MNKRQKEVELAKLADEEKELNQLKAIYSKASDDIQKKIRISDGKINFLLSEFDSLDDEQKSVLQSQIYQKQFQESLKKQIDGFMEELSSGQYKSVKCYMERCYETGYIGTMYDIAGQGIPLIMPIDQKQVARAMSHDTKLSAPLYKRLGIDLDLMKKQIANSIARGIATASGYSVIVRSIALDSKAGFNRAMRIARTEGHRIQVLSAVDAQHDAKDAGADVAKQWDSTLDGRTRPHHRMLDGQVREIDEPFEVEGIKVMHPSGFGMASEDINCRCALLQRAKWALDEEELETLKERAAYFGLDKAKDFDDFRKRYNVAARKILKQQNVDITEGGKFTKLSISNVDEYARYIEHEFTTQRITVKKLHQMWDKSVGYIQNTQGYQDINNWLRGLRPRLDNPKRRVTVNVMNRLTKNNALKKDYIGIRRVDSGYIKNVLGIDITGLFKDSFQKNTFGSERKVKIPKDKASAGIVADRINALAGTEKRIIPDNAFTSVSLSEGLNYFTHFPVKIEIQMPAGTKGVITNNLQESEFIAKPKSSIEILGAEVYNDGNKDCVKIFARIMQ